MTRRAVAIAALVLLLLPAADAASSGARSPITVEGTVNDVAISSGGRFAAASLDPEDRFTGDPEVPVWNLWNPDGSLRQAGDADPASCDTPTTTPLTEDCKTGATRIAVSGDGTRIAILSDKSGSQAGMDLLSVYNDAGVLLSPPVEFGMNVVLTDVAFSRNGNRIAVAADIPSQSQTPNDRDGLVQVFDGSGKNGLFTGEGITFTSPAKKVSLSPDGAYLAVAAGAHHYYKLSVALNDHPHTVSGATAEDVDVSATDGWSVAGFSNGFFGLYSKDISQSTPRVYQKKESSGDTSGLTAVAIAPDATSFVTGTSGGTLRYYRLDTSADADSGGLAVLTSTKGSLGAVGELAYSGDSRYVVLKAGSDVRMYRATASALDELWKDTRTGLGPSVAVDERGEHVIASTGATVLVYDAIHELTPTLPSQTQDPGTEADYVVSYRNDGNRMEDITLSASPPAGVEVSINPPSFTVVPGSTKAVTVTVTLPTTRAPGSTTIPLTHKLSDGADGSDTVNLVVSVPTKRDLDLEAAGAASLGARPGQPATFDLLATNNGNVQESGDLTLTGLPSGWTASVDPERLDLAPGAFVEVAVTVTPPAGAPNLSQADLVLQRAGGPSIDLTVTVGAGFGTALDGPRGASLSPGLAQLLNLTVKNTGNAPDTIVVRLGTLPSGWQAGFLSGLPEHRVEDLEPGESAVVQATVRPPPDSNSTVPVQFTATAQSLADPSKTDNHLVLLTVDGSRSESSSGDGGGGSGIPGVPPMLLAAALAALAVALRRRTA